MASNYKSSLPRNRFATMLRSDYPLCRDDVIWMLETLKKKMADEASALSDLPQPQLLRMFQAFAEVSMMLIKNRHGCDTEIERLRSSLQEAAHALDL
ncbi:hypothetical protein [Paenibacillus sp. GCM10027626]|uniref:hypothetical protein n=1 Tax=Paenibacillus sp. GCM10027626 TaxID=3273411 RepID=UPI003628B4EE